MGRPFRKRDLAVVTFALAASYAATGLLARYLAIAPGYAAAIWPPAGIALAAVLRFSCRAAPGVWLGSCATNLAISYAVAGGELGAWQWLVSAGLGLGALVQACGARWLIRRYLGPWPELVAPREIGLFLVLGGPIACCIGSSCGVAILAAAGLIAPENIAFSWLTWWVGDAVGVMIFAPLTMAILSPPQPLWQRRIRTVAAPSLAVFLTVVGFFAYALAWERERTRTAFQRDALEIAFRMRLRLELFEEVAGCVGRFYDGSQFVDQQEFRNFVTPVLRQHRDVLAMGWVAHVPSAQRAAFEADAQTQVAPGFAILEPGVGPNPAPAADRDEYYPCMFVEPAPFRERMTGYDLGGEATRRAAMLYARDTGRATATAPLQLLHDPDGARTCILFQPVYKPVLPAEITGQHTPAAIALRRARLSGFGVCVIDPQCLEHVLRDVPIAGATLSVIDATTKRRPFVFARAEAAAADAGRPGPGQSAELSYTSAFEFGGRKLQCRVSGGQLYLARERSGIIWNLLASGLVLTSFVQGVLLYLSGSTERVHRLIDQRTEELRESSAQTQRHLQELRAVNDELQRFNRLAVDQELRVLALKLEVDDLRIAAGLPKKYAALAHDMAVVQELTL